MVSTQLDSYFCIIEERVPPEGYQQGTILFEKDEALEQRDEAFAERDVALAEKQAALEEKAAAIAEVERLKALLAQKWNRLCQFSEKDLPIRQQMTVYGELDAVKLREQQVIAERDAIAAERDVVALREQQALEEIEKLKALLAAKQS